MLSFGQIIVECLGIVGIVYVIVVAISAVERTNKLMRDMLRDQTKSNLVFAERAQTTSLAASMDAKDKPAGAPKEREPFMRPVT